jgi:hypothetical protein
MYLNKTINPLVSTVVYTQIEFIWIQNRKSNDRQIMSQTFGSGSTGAAIIQGGDMDSIHDFETKTA